MRIKCPKCKERFWPHEMTEVIGSPSDQIFITGGNHPKLTKARTLLQEAKALENWVRDKGAEARKKLPKAAYSHKIIVGTAKASYWSGDPPEGAETVRINSELTNPEVFSNHVSKWGSLLGPPDSHKSSVTYYRNYGILFRSGGGHCLLEDKQPCSDEEWEAIKTGNIPEKFLR